MLSNFSTSGFVETGLPKNPHFTFFDAEFFSKHGISTYLFYRERTGVSRRSKNLGKIGESEFEKIMGLIFGGVFRILESLGYLQVCFEYIVGSLDIDMYVNM